MDERPAEPQPFADRGAPYSAEAELAVLGGMLIDGDALTKAVEIVDDSMFYREGNRRAFRAMRRIFERGEVIDPVTLAEELRGAGDLEAVGGLQFIVSLLDAVPTAANIEQHARIVREKAVLRRVVGTAHLAGMEPANLDVLAALQAVAEEARDTLAGSAGAAGRRRLLAAPLSWEEVQGMPEPEHVWFVEGLLPASANALCAAYPKSHKTNLLLALFIAVALGVPALGRFDVPRRRRVGLVLMEGAAHQLRRRIVRICHGLGRDPADLHGWLYVWFRPRLKFADARAMRDLAAHVREYELDAVGVDCWAPVATGNSNDADDVSPQLDAFADLRAASGNPALTVVLIHHARKTQGGGGGGGEGRITDLIRGSGGFGAWYDVGLALSRQSEASPHVTVRLEARDYSHLPSFTFEVADEHPGTEAGPPSGWLRLQAAQPGEARAQITDTERIALERLAEVQPATNAEWRAAAITRPPHLGSKSTFDRAVRALLPGGYVIREDTDPRRPRYSVSGRGERALESAGVMCQGGVIEVSRYHPDEGVADGVMVSPSLRGVTPDTAAARCEGSEGLALLFDGDDDALPDPGAVTAAAWGAA